MQNMSPDSSRRQCDAGSPICEWMRETRAKLGTPQKRDQGQSVR